MKDSKVTDLHKKGFSLREIAQQTGYSKSKVHRLVSDNKKPSYKSIAIKFTEIKVPEFKQIRGKDWISYGEKNLYPDSLIEYYHKSARHGAVINGKVNAIVGMGFEDNPGISTIVGGEHLNAYIRDIVLDYEIFNGVAISVTWDLMGEKIASIKHIDFAKIRTNVNENTYYYSDNWEAHRQSPEETGYKEYPAFNPKEKGGTQLFVFYNKSPKPSGDVNVYPVPEYVSGIAAIETDIEISQFHLSNIKTGFHAGTMINFNNGVPTDEEADAIEKDVKAKAAGTDKAGAILLNFSDGKDNAATIERIMPSDLDKQFIELEKRVGQEIFTSHKVTSPMIFGVKTEGQLGGRTEILEAYELFYTIYVKGRQDTIEKIFSYILSFNGISEMVINESKMVKESSNYAVADLNTLMDMYKSGKLGREGFIGILTENMGYSEEVANKIAGANTQMSTDDKFMFFSKYGSSKDDYEIIDSKGIKLDGNGLVSYEFLDSELSEIAIKALELIRKDPFISSVNIASALNITPVRASEILRTLTDQGYISSKEIEDGVSREVVKEIPKLEEEIFLMYSYEVNPDISNQEIIPTTRDFCRRLIGLNRMYTRQEIELLQNDIGESVWHFKGGFYRVPGTSTSLPYCRHMWMQHIVKKKK